MSSQQKALWFSGIFSAVLTAVIISEVHDARVKLDDAIITNATQSADISHNAKRLDNFAMVLKDIFEGQRILQNGNTELKIGQAELFQILKSWEPDGKKE